MIELLNLGGGVQSSRLLEESIAGDLPRIDFAIFADTGWEPQTVYDHVDYLTAKAKRAGIPVIRVDGGDLRNDALVAQKAGGVMRQSATDAAAVVEATGIPRRRWASMPMYTLKEWQPIQSDIDILEAAILDYEGKPGPEIDTSQFLWLDEEATEDTRQREATKLRGILGQLRNGKPIRQQGMIKRQCTQEYKIQPIERFIKTDILGLDAKGRWPRECKVRQWFGISHDESQRCRASRSLWKVHWYPLVDRRITRMDCYGWFAKLGLPLPPRSACKGCPFHSDVEWREMKLRLTTRFVPAAECGVSATCTDPASLCER